MSSNRQYSLTLSTSIVALVLAGAAHGQEPAGSAPQRTTHGREEIVVISQKRGVAENLQTVPISVASITVAALAERHMNNISGLAISISIVQINRVSNSADSA